MLPNVTEQPPRYAEGNFLTAAGRKQARNLDPHGKGMKGDRKRDELQSDARNKAGFEMPCSGSIHVHCSKQAVGLTGCCCASLTLPREHTV